MNGECAYITLNVPPHWGAETTTRAIGMLIDAGWLIDLELVEKLPLEVVFYRPIE